MDFDLIHNRSDLGDFKDSPGLENVEIGETCVYVSYLLRVIKGRRNDSPMDRALPDSTSFSIACHVSGYRLERS